MVRRKVLGRTLLVIATVLSGAVAEAQDTAPAGGTTRCGGLLCDLYYAGKPAPVPGQPEAPDPTRLPCRDFLCAAFGGRTAEPPPPPPEPAAAVPPAPAKAAKRRAKPRRTVATAETPRVDK